MCLILFALKEHPKYSLIVAANRDEFYARPTADAHIWKDYPSVVAGKDLQAEGTWMGVSKKGKISMLTNYRDLANIKSDAPSRGHLVADFLIKDVDADGYLEGLKKHASQYNGYNIIFGNKDKLIYFSNISEKPQILEKGIFGISNHLLDSKWAKVTRGKVKLRKAIREYESIDPEYLFESLYDDIKAPDHQLPDTGVGIEMERMLSPMFIKSAEYGSRCSTVVLVDNNGKWQFLERVYNTNDFSYRTNQYNFREVKF